MSNEIGSLVSQIVPAQTMNLAICSFCAPAIRERILADRGTVFVVHDCFPVTEGHLLILFERHTPA